MHRDIDPDHVPTHLRLRVPEGLSTDAFRGLLGHLGALGIQAHSPRYPEDSMSSSAEARPQGSSGSRPTPETTGEQVKVTLSDFLSFADQAGQDTTLATSSWGLLREFWGQQETRAEYLRRPISETNLPLRAKISTQHSLPLTFHIGEESESPVECLDLAGLYQTVVEIIPTNKHSLIKGLGPRRIQFLADFLNNTLNSELYPPILL